MKLTDEYKRITEQFKDLQSKFRHFEQVSVQRCGKGTTCQGLNLGGLGRVPHFHKSGIHTFKCRWIPRSTPRSSR